MERRSMNKTNKIKCPRCHSDQLYKFGLDKQANQKYQCKKCKDNLLLIPSVSRKYLNIQGVQNAGKLPIYIMLTSIIIVINAVIKNVTI